MAMAGERTFNLRDFGLFHLPYKLACVGAERFNVAALPFGVNSIKRERSFSRAADTRQRSHLSMRNIDVHVFEVVFRSTLDRDGCSFLLCLLKRVSKFGFLEPLLCVAPDIEVTSEGLPSIRFGHLSDLFRCPYGNNIAAANTSLWS